MAKSTMSKTSTMSSPANSTDCTLRNTMMYVSYSIAIIILIVIITSLNNLEHSNCKCTDLPYREYLKEWFIFSIFYIISLMAIFAVSNEECWVNFQNYPYIYGAMIIYSIIHIIMLIRLFLYVRLLRNSCDCGYGNKERFIYWYLIIIFSIWAIIIVLGFIMLLFTIIKFFSGR